MIINADAIEWARAYNGDPFHALICDPPYHLTTITDRFGGKDSAPAKEGRDGAFKRLSTGFMNQVWDGGDIAFQPETWESFLNILYPGAFGMAFGGSRTAHRMAVAIEDAGFIIHPQMSWLYATGFPKATRVKDSEVFEGHRYGLQALKPASEPIIVFQKPYEGRPIDDINETGAGALNIEASRIGSDNTQAKAYKMTSKDIQGGGFGSSKMGYDRIDLMAGSKSGRWPANVVLTHSPQCQMIGYRSADSYQINRFTDGAKPFGDGAGHEFESEEIQGGKVLVWECVDGCPVKALDKQSGHLTSGTGAVKKATSAGHQGNVYGEESRPEGTPNIEYGDSGGASRFFHQSHWAIENADPFVYQAKVAVSEREAGLLSDVPCIICGELDSTKHQNEKGEWIDCKRCGHPTLKPITLIEHLASLLLPPEEYKPRRIIVPFAGVASEVIGCWRAGWNEITGIELKEEYWKIGIARLEYWQSLGIQLDLFGSQ